MRKIYLFFIFLLIYNYSFGFFKPIVMEKRIFDDIIPKICINVKNSFSGVHQVNFEITFKVSDDGTTCTLNLNILIIMDVKDIQKYTKKEFETKILDSLKKEVTGKLCWKDKNCLIRAAVIKYVIIPYKLDILFPSGTKIAFNLSNSQETFLVFL